MIRTHGLNHVSLRVADLERALRFYTEVFGVREYVREERVIQCQGPGEHDILVFELAEGRAGVTGGIDHFGFRLVDPGDIDAAAAAIEGAGGSIERKGEFSPGYPYLFARDPDGYTVEVWYE